MGTDQHKKIDVTELIGQRTNVCLSIELWSPTMFILEVTMLEADQLNCYII